jgi:hypothetical protein
MNAQVQPTESRALTLAERATAAINIDKTEQQLTELAASTTTIVEITNPAGYQQVHSARMTLKNQRVEIEKAGKQARDDANAFSRAVIAAEKKLLAIIEPEETRLHKLQLKWDADREAEKLAKTEAEKVRVAAIQERIKELRGNQSLTSLHASSLIADHIADLQKLPADKSFQEFQEQAVAAKAGGLERLQQILGAAEAREAEEKRLAEARAELEREKAEAKRIETIKARIERIKSFITDRLTTSSSSELIQAALSDAHDILVNDSYQEFREQAASAREAVISVLQQMLADRAAHEQEQARLKAEREENERIARERQAELDRQAEAQRKEREDFERQQREHAERFEAERNERERLLAEQLVTRDTAPHAAAPTTPSVVYGEITVGYVPLPVTAQPPSFADLQPGDRVSFDDAISAGKHDDLIDFTVTADGPTTDEIISTLMDQYDVTREVVVSWLISAVDELLDQVEA